MRFEIKGNVNVRLGTSQFGTFENHSAGCRTEQGDAKAAVEGRRAALAQERHGRRADAAQARVHCQPQPQRVQWIRHLQDKGGLDSESGMYLSLRQHHGCFTSCTLQIRKTPRVLRVRSKWQARCGGDTVRACAEHFC